MGTIIGFAARIISNSVMKRLDAIVSELQSISIKLTESRGEIKNLQDKDVTTQSRLNDHAVRLRNLEINQGKNNQHP